MRRVGRAWVAWLAVASALCVPPAAAVPPGGAMSRPDSTGRSLVLVQRPWPALLQVTIQFHQGALADPVGQEGRAVLCWDAALRAGGGRDHATFAAALDGLGAKIDADVGQSTTRVTVAGLSEHADAMMALLADAVLRPTFAASDVDEVRAQRLAELADRADDDDATAAEGVVRYAWRGSPLARPLDGTPASVQRLKVEDCRAAHGAILGKVAVDIGIAGAITRKDAEALVRKHLGGLGNPSAAPHGVPKPPPGDGRRLLILDHPSQSAAQVALALRTPGARDPAGTAISVGDALLAGAFTSRLSQQVRELRGWTYSIHSNWAAGANHGLWILQWAPRNAVVAKSIDLVVRHLEIAAAEGATRKEVDFARDYLRGSQRHALETAEADVAARLRSRALGLPVDWIDGFEARLDAVDRKQVGAAMARTFAADDVVVVVVGDAARLRPSLEKMASGFAIEVLPREAAPEATTMPGRKPVRTVARPDTRPRHDESEDQGPAFDDSGEAVDPPPASTETDDEPGAEDEGDDDADDPGETP